MKKPVVMLLFVFLLLSSPFFFHLELFQPAEDSYSPLRDLTSQLEFKILSVTEDSIFLDAPANNSILRSGTEIHLTIWNISLSEVTFHWDFQPNMTFFSPYVVTLPLGDGPHILHVYARDVADTWEYKHFHFITDDSPPLIFLDPIMNNSIQIPDTLFQLLIDEPFLDRVIYQWDTGGNQSLEEPYLLVFPREEGRHDLYLYASDLAGNWAGLYYQFTVRADLSPDSDNDGLSDYLEFLLDTNPLLPTNSLMGASLQFGDLATDTPDDLETALIAHTHIKGRSWIIGTVSELVTGLEDQTDVYLFSSAIRTTNTVFIQTHLPGVCIQIFDLEGRVNLTKEITFANFMAGSGARAFSSSAYLPNAFPYVVEIPIPLAVELLVIQINTGFSSSSFYSLWIDDTPIASYLPVLSLSINFLIFLGLPFMFFLVLRWENRRLTKKHQKLQAQLAQESLEDVISESLPKVSPPIVVQVGFIEWLFSSFVLFFMVILFSELSREKFLNQVSFLTAKSFVDLGYRLFFLAITLIFLGSLLSFFFWTRDRIRSPSMPPHRSWIRRGFLFLIKISIIFGIYFALWLFFVQLLIFFEPIISNSTFLPDLLTLFQTFFATDLSTPPSPNQFILLSQLGILELLFIVFSLPLICYMFLLNFAGGTSVRNIFRPLDASKSHWNYKTIILGISLLLELYRVISNLFNFLLSYFFVENPTFFFIQLSELPWWHQLVTWISQETFISTSVLYGLYFELQGIFFAWVIYTSFPSVIRRIMSGSGLAKILIRIGLFLLGMFVIFLRTLHLLLLIPLGVPSFPFSVILSDPFSILLLVAMISDALETLGFSLGLILMLLIYRIRKAPKKKTPPTVVSPPQEEYVDTSNSERILSPYSEEE